MSLPRLEHFAQVRHCGCRITNPPVFPMRTYASARPLRGPVSPVDTCPLSPTPSDVAASDPESEIDPENRAAKRRRIEQFAQEYLSGQQIFILSAGLKGPFDKDWINPWEKKSKRADRYTIDETPGCATASKRKKRKTDGKQEGAGEAAHDELAVRGPAKVNNENEKALAGGKMGARKQPPLEREPVLGEGNGTTVQSPKGIPKVNIMAAPSTETWLKRTAASCRPRNPGPNDIGASTLTLEVQKPPDPATTMVTALLPHASDHLEATATASASTPVEPPGTTIHTGFTPINKSSKSMFYMHASDTGLVVKADGNEMKTKKKPRHVDFAAMSSPNGPEYKNRLGVPPKLKAKSKAPPSLTKGYDGEWTTEVSLSGQGGGELTPTAIPPSTVARHQRVSVLGDESELPGALKPSAATPTLVPDRPWTTHIGGPVLGVQSNHKKRESFEDNISTQVEILNAQRLFQAEIPSPEKKSPSLPGLAPMEPSFFGTKTGGATTLISTGDVPAFRSFNVSYQDGNTNEDNNGDSPDTDVINTQELMDAVSPFSFSTAKKRPNKLIFTKHASFIQTPSKQTSFALDGEGGAFGKMGLDMETSQEIEEPASPPEEGPTMATQEQVIPTKVAPISSTAARLSLPPSAASSSVTAKSRKLGGGSDNIDSEEEMNDCIDDISNFLEGWDLESELKRVAAAKPAGVSAVANKKGILSKGGWL